MPIKKLSQRELTNWFTTKVRSSTGIRKNIINNVQRSSDVASIGKLYFFWYDPKHKDKLPTYDRFPLVFPIEPYEDGFLGLNLHYLSFDERSAILGGLMKFAEDKTLSTNTKLSLSYGLLSSTRGLNSLMRPCIKRYLFSQVRSRFIEITTDEWDKAAQLGVEVFVTNPRPSRK